MPFVIVREDGKYLKRATPDRWTDLNKASTWSSLEAANSAGHKVKETILIQEVAYLLWGSPVPLTKVK